MSTLLEDGLGAYEAAKGRAELMRAEWERLGCPILSVGGATGRAEVVHPLLRAINDAEALADRLRQHARQAHAGPRPSAVVQAEIGASPASKLRSVG